MQKDRHANKTRRERICAHLGIRLEELEPLMVEMYTEKRLSSHEIAEFIEQNTGESITPRSIQRILKPYNVTRTGKQAFQNAIKRGRVQWKYKDFKIKRVKLNKKLRFQILERDNFRCTLCGADAKVALLEVDHTKPVCQGGLSTLENMRTLCFSCNKGKQLHKNER